MMGVPDQIVEIVQKLDLDLDQEQQRLLLQVIVMIHAGTVVMMQENGGRVFMNRQTADSMLGMIESALYFAGIKLSVVSLHARESDESDESDESEAN